jgi:multisubunit Na+/H+ antiporter MnhB subunit
MNSKKRNTSRLDLAMAAFAGASVAFAAFAMPQAPVDQTARLLMAAAAGALGFGLVWLVLRSLGTHAAPRKRHDVGPDADAEPGFAPLAEEEEDPFAGADYPRFTPIEEGHEAAGAGRS